jgi:ATP-dependent Clp protease ATP-binding subunit ClpC
VARIRDEEKRRRAEFEDAKNDWAKRKDDRTLTVGASEIADVVTQWTGIPVSRLLEDESERLLRLENVLGERVIGQAEATGAVARAIRRGRTGLKDPRRPIGSFIFLGQTGVGKTELCRALADAMFGSEDAMIRLDMSEYMEKHSVSKLIGSPPGYVGFEEGGQLTEKLRRRPYTVVLLDEIEKAHPDVFNLLLQMLDEGVLTDSQGRRVDCRNTVIIMTSNLGAASEHSKKTLGFTGFGGSALDGGDAAHKEARERMMRALREAFRPEFINRVDDIIVFRSLDESDIRRIATLMLGEVKKRLMNLNIDVTFDDEVTALIARDGFDPLYGARPLRRAIIRLIEDRISGEMLEGRIKQGDSLLCTVKDGQITFSPHPAGETESETAYLDVSPAPTDA